MKQKRDSYFSTRDLMMMAALAALGGITSTYINMIGDFFQSLLGFAGTTQWAAGLHVIWLMLAAVLVGKPGAASITGIIKGFVELLSGNTHGILVVIVDIVAGLVVDFVLLLNKDKKPNILFYLAAGLASASNVTVFQVFVSLPSDVLALIAIFGTSALAFVSGVLFGGVIVKSLVSALEKVGVIHRKDFILDRRKRVWAMLAIVTAILITSGAGYFVYSNQIKVSTVSIAGEVAHPFSYPDAEFTYTEKEVEVSSNGATRKYSGVALKEIIANAGPLSNAGVVLIKASDGYSFFVDMEEINQNENLILTEQKSGNESMFNVVGAVSQKAWIRGVSEIFVMPKDTFEVSGNINSPFSFDPQDWLEEMDSIYFSIEGEQKKLQGVPLQELVVFSDPIDPQYQVLVKGSEGEITFESEKLLDNTDIRIFTYPKESGFEFILGQMDGTILVRHVSGIEIQ